MEKTSIVQVEKMTWPNSTVSSYFGSYDFNCIITF